MEVQDIIDSFSSMEKETEVHHRPPARTTYVFSWTDDKKKGKYRFGQIFVIGYVSRFLWLNVLILYSYKVVNSVVKSLINWLLTSP